MGELPSLSSVLFALTVAALVVPLSSSDVVVGLLSMPGCLVKTCVRFGLDSGDA